MNTGLGEIVPEYHSKNPFVRWLFYHRLAVALNYVKKLGPNSLLDAGCGEGAFIELVTHILPLGIESLWAIDINPDVEKLALKYPHCHFGKQDIRETSFPEKKFDLIVCLDVLEHIKDIEMAMSELRRILKDGGYLIVSGPVESLFYKSLRFLIKYRFSERTGPGAGAHFYDIQEVDCIIAKNFFEKQATKKLPDIPQFALFNINLYKKSAHSQRKYDRAKLTQKLCETFNFISERKCHRLV